MHRGSAEDQTVDRPPEDIEGRLITRSLPCLSCGYELRGLAIGGDCPECGRPVWRTVLDTIDPALERLPRMRNPKRVGQGLLALMACVVMASFLLLARSAAMLVDEMRHKTLADAEMWTPPWLCVAASGLLVLGLVAMLLIAPPRREERGGTIWRDIRAVSLGLALAAVVPLAALAGAAWIRSRPLSEADIRFGEQSLMRLTAVMVLLLTLIPIRGILDVIGERSQQYRTARGGRQRILEMGIAAGGVALAEIVRVLARARDAEATVTFATVVVIVCTVMLAVGLGYLLVNAWWIQRSLRRPVPTFRQLLREDVVNLPFIGDPAPPPPRPSAPGPDDARADASA